MSTKSAVDQVAPRESKRRRPSRTQPPLTPFHETIEQINQTHADGNLEGLHRVSIDLAQKQHAAEERLAELSEILSAMKEKFDAITAHEHHKATITGVYNNGARTVEVAGLGRGRSHVAVEPEVDTSLLRVGASALVTRERNCVLKVLPSSSPCTEVATFEAYIDGGQRLLLKDRDSYITVGIAHQLEGTELRKGDLVGFDREHSQLAFERIEQPDKQHLFDDSIEGDFGELVGLDEQITLIRDVISFRLQNPEIAKLYVLPARYGMLLHGRPGNGKTHLARATAAYLKTVFPGVSCRFMHIEGSSDYSMWLGGSERRIIERFTAAREAARDGTVVMFFDELDAIGRRRGSDHGSNAGDRILNTLLTQLDGVLQLSNIVVMAATNRPDTLDEGLTRSGRFDRKVEIPAPNYRTSAAILSHYLGNRPLAAGSPPSADLVSSLLAMIYTPNGEYREVARVKVSDGRWIPVAGRELISGATLKNVVDVAARRAAKRHVQTGVAGLHEADLVAAIDVELRSAVSLLSPANIKGHVPSIPRDSQPIDVEPLLPPRSTHIRSFES